jgi:hypothetical protein
VISLAWLVLAFYLLVEKLPAYGASQQTVGLVLPTGYAFISTARRCSCRWA